MSVHLKILMSLHLLAGCAVWLAGFLFACQYSSQINMYTATTFILSALRMTSRILIMLFGVVLFVSGMSMPSKKTWVWNMGVACAAVCIGSIILMPIGIYGMFVLMKPTTRIYYGHPCSKIKRARIYAKKK